MACAIDTPKPKWYLYLESKGVNPIKLWPESIQKMQKFFLCAIAFHLELHSKSDDFSEPSTTEWYKKAIIAYNHFSGIKVSKQTLSIRRITGSCGWAADTLENELKELEDIEIKALYRYDVYDGDTETDDGYDGDNETDDDKKYTDGDEDEDHPYYRTNAVWRSLPGNELDIEYVVNLVPNPSDPTVFLI